MPPWEQEVGGRWVTEVEADKRGEVNAEADVAKEIDGLLVRCHIGPRHAVVPIPVRVLDPSTSQIKRAT